MRPVHAGLSIYENGLAIIFLCELNPSKYQAEINIYLKSLAAKQRRQGGWGYLDNPKMPGGDTSMTQYGVLACWEAKRHGFVVPITSIEAVCMWQMRTPRSDRRLGVSGSRSRRHGHRRFPVGQAGRCLSGPLGSRLGEHVYLRPICWA